MPVVSGDVIKGCLPVGLILGQITFGYLGDTFGRKKVYGRELMFTMFGTLMCILLPWKGLSHNGIVAWMAVWRLFTGFGIGGGKVPLHLLSGSAGCASDHIQTTL